MKKDDWSRMVGTIWLEQVVGVGWREEDGQNRMLQQVDGAKLFYRNGYSRMSGTDGWSRMVGVE